MCNWNGSACYAWDFRHGDTLSCEDHARCTGAFALSGGETQRADYGSLLDMTKDYYGFQAKNQGVGDAGADITIVITSNSSAPAQIKVTVLSFDDYTDKTTKQESILEVAGTRETIVNADRNWSSPPSGSFTQPCRVGESTSFYATVGYEGKSTFCSQSVNALPPDLCGRNSRTPSLESEPNYGNPDCCAGVKLEGTFNAYGRDHTAREEFGSEKVNDGYLQWMCQRNSSAVTVANPTTMYNLAHLGWTNDAKNVLTTLFNYAFDKKGKSFRDKVGTMAKKWQALTDWETTINNGNVANSCFVCGMTRTIGGCFPPGVLVAMGDGSYSKRVEDITAGELLWNPLLKKGFTVLTISEGREHKDLVVVRAGGQTLRMTTEHPVLTKSGMKQAIALVVGDIVLDASGHESPIEAITREPATSGLSVLNFILERSGSAHDGLLLADGLVVGDLTIQRRLAAHENK